MNIMKVSLYTWIQSREINGLSQEDMKCPLRLLAVFRGDSEL